MARIALVLGSGGARGYAHLGAAAELRARGHHVVAVSGTSMGALVGALIASETDQEFAAWARSLTGPRVLRLVDPTWSPGGAVGAERVMTQLEQLVGDIDIEDLPIPFTAIATDLLGRREVWFQRGPLIPAIRASIAIPGLFTPSAVNGRVLVDGGLMNPLPLAPMAAVDADLTVAVSLQGPREPGESEAPTRGFAARRAEWAGQVRRRFRRGDGTGSQLDPGVGQVAEEAADATLGDAGADGGDGVGGGGGDLARTAAEEQSPGGAGAGAEVGPAETAESAAGAVPAREVAAELRTTDVVSMSFDAMQSLITRYRLAALPPDVLVTVPLSAARTLDFHRAAELIDVGRELTAAALDEAGY